MESLLSTAPPPMPDDLEKLSPVYRDCQNQGTYDFPPAMINSWQQGVSDSRMIFRDGFSGDSR